MSKTVMIFLIVILALSTVTAIYVAKYNGLKVDYVREENNLNNCNQAITNQNSEISNYTYNNQKLNESLKTNIANENTQLNKNYNSSLNYVIRNNNTCEAILNGANQLLVNSSR